MDQNFVIPIILSGGVGSRLWPLSREQHPKPFIKLADGQSLLQKTYIRATQVVDTPEIVTITNRELFFYTKDEYEETEVDAKKTYILEPFGKNTAAAIALAGHYILSKYGDKAKILILSADHLIKETKIFAEAIHKANELIEKDKIVTFGIKPTFPHIGYGYIESKGECVSKFIEKPNIEKATEYFKSGNYFWNAGIFCMNAQKYLYELKNILLIFLARLNWLLKL